MATSSGLFLVSDNLQPIGTRGKKARGTLLVDQHCGNGCSIKLAPLSVSYYNEISGGHIGRGLFGGGILPAQYCPCERHSENKRENKNSNVTSRMKISDADSAVDMTPCACVCVCELVADETTFDPAG